MGFNWIDGTIVVFYLIAITLFGVRFRKKQQSIHTYFLGGKTIPAWALSLSIVATETSTLTIIGTPGIAFGGDLSFLQLVLGYMVGRIFISLVLIPAYFKGEMYTAYQLMERRFGQRIKHATASLFLVTRALAEGVRVLAIATVVGIVLGTGDLASILIISALTLIYTFEGGLTAVIWTDVVQLFIYIGGTLVAFFTILSYIPGGWEGVMANAGHKFVLWNFSTSYHVPYTFWAGVIGGAFLNTASHGVDQLIVQRLLAARNERDSKAALLSSGLVIFFQFSLFLVVGIMLYSFYLYHPEESVPAMRDRIFPTFVVRHLPSRSLRLDDRRHPGRGDVEPQQFPQLAGLDYRRRLLHSLPEAGRGHTRATAHLAVDDGRLGNYSGSPGFPVTRRGIGTGGWPDHSLHHIRQSAGCLPPRGPHAKGE